MVFSRRQHPLPKFPPDIIPTFENSCETLRVDQIPELKNALVRETQALSDRAETNRLLNRALIAFISDRCAWMLERYAEYTAKQQALIVGAVRYFASEQDPLPDGEFASGLHDDAAVVNYVLEELGADESLYIELHNS